MTKSGHRFPTLVTGRSDARDPLPGDTIELFLKFHIFFVLSNVPKVDADSMPIREDPVESRLKGPSTRGGRETLTHKSGLAIDNGKKSNSLSLSRFQHPLAQKSLTDPRNIVIMLSKKDNMIT